MAVNNIFVHYGYHCPVLCTFPFKYESQDLEFPKIIYLGVSRQFVQTVCNDMLSRGFIEFTDNPRHKRSKLAALTESGRIAFRQARQKENEIIEQALPGIDSDKVIEACKLLECVRKAVQKIPNDPTH